MYDLRFSEMLGKYIIMPHNLLKSASVLVELFACIQPGSCACYLLHASFLLGLVFSSEEGGEMFLQNVSLLFVDCTVLCPRR
jgi:hypothetical protein